ncbi:MAG TPA: APC family permease, partial [Chloroflexota bacterium]
MNDSTDGHDPGDPRSDPRGDETGTRSKGKDAERGDERAAGRDLTRIERTRGVHPGDQFVRFRSHPDFRRLRSGHLVPSEESAEAHGGVGRTLSGVKRFLLGRPLTTAEERGERLGRFTGLSILASDNISSSAYATEEIMRVLVLAGVAALALTLPITLGICAVLAIVVLSYREVIRAYPGGGGSYVVAKDNLGPVAGLTAAAALLTDYVLTVSVSVAAGIAAITSALPGLADSRVAIMVAVVALVMVVNLRGVRESGRAFAVPTYVYLVAILGLVALGVFRYLTASLPSYEPPAAWLAAEAGAPGALGLLLLLRAFASGSVALTGTEAVSNGVPSFRPPEVANARAVLVAMGALFGTIFVGISFLSGRLGLIPD